GGGGGRALGGARRRTCTREADPPGGFGVRVPDLDPVPFPSAVELVLVSACRRRRYITSIHHFSLTSLGDPLGTQRDYEPRDTRTLRRMARRLRADEGNRTPA